MGNFSPDVTDGSLENLPRRYTVYDASGAIALVDHIAFLTKAGVGAMTLATPTGVTDGTTIVISSDTAQAHTVTYTAGFRDDTTSGDVLTFGGAIGDSCAVIAYGDKWRILWLHNVTVG